ncbi:MAG: ChaN family lipoprotein [Roseovarius sp.]
MRGKVWAAAILCAGLGGAAAAQDITVIGEVHDNPAHHAAQARIVAGMAPRALVFEMLTPEQAGRVADETPREAAVLEELFGWAESGWPAFSLYFPIIEAAPEARIYGAGVTRAQAREAMEANAAGGGVLPEEELRLFGLDAPLPEDEQAAREALQMAAHCDALPEEMLPGMVRIQRLRDAMLAHAALEALEETGGPVAVITGNGHARMDWGMPALVARAAPEVALRVIGQTEEGVPLPGGFDEVLSAPAAEREDPCAAFR